MLEEEVIDMLIDELAEFLENYVIMTSFVHEAFKLDFKDQELIALGSYQETYFSNEFYFKARHQIKKAGRTKLRFSFQFYKDEREYAMNLIKLLDGYIDYSFSNSSDYYFCGFTIDIGSKANFKRFFDGLSFTDEE